MVLAYTADAWTQVIVALSIFVPLTIAVVITIAVLRGSKNDPDEQRWKRQAEARERAEHEDEHEVRAKSRPH